MKHPGYTSSQNYIIMPHQNNFVVGAPVLDNFVVGPPIDISPASMIKPTNRKKVFNNATAPIIGDVNNNMVSSHHNEFFAGPLMTSHHDDFVVGPPPPPMDGDIAPPPSMRKPHSRKKLDDFHIVDVTTSNKRRRRTMKNVNWGSLKCHSSSVTQNDINQMWYNEHELKMFKEERRRVVKAIKNVRGDLSALEGTEYVTRGFECYQSIKFNRTIREQRKVVIESVLRTQHKQRLCCEYDPEEIALMCRRRSSWARSWATDLGMKDSSTILEEEKTPELVKEYEYAQINKKKTSIEKVVNI